VQSIKILGIDYSIEIKKEFDEPETLGESNEQLSHIAISNKLSDALFRETLFHEVIHQVDERLKLGLTEQRVQGLSTGLHCVYRENSFHLISNPGIGR